MAKEDSLEHSLGGCVLAFGQLFLTLSVSALTGVYGAFVFLKLWEWFVVPTFSLPAIDLRVAYGLGCIAAICTMHISPNKTPQTRSVGEILFIRAFSLSMTFGCGYVAHLLA